MKRRDFIQKTVAGSALLTVGGLSLSSFNTLNKKHITILHTNDVHSHIDPFPPTDAKNPNMGGVSRRASLIESIRRKIQMFCFWMPVIYFRELLTSTIMAANWNLS